MELDKRPHARGRYRPTNRLTIQAESKEIHRQENRAGDDSTMNRKGIVIGIFIAAFALALPMGAMADWKVYYTGKAAKMFGSYGRGSFATRMQCEAYRTSRPGFESGNSYCSGFDTVASAPVKPAQPKNTGAAQQQQQQQQQQAADQARAAAEKAFADDKANLLGSMKVPDSSNAAQPNVPGADDGLKPAGTSFFGLGGGSGTTESAAVSAEAQSEQADYDRMNTEWIRKQKLLIAERLKKPNKYVPIMYRSLKLKAPPPLPPTKWDNLRPGDVLLISREGITDPSFWINLGDRLTTDMGSPASHTVLYLKTVNGRKLFLDHTPAKGSQVIDEAEFLRRYGHRGVLVASPRIDVAQPVKEAETARIWDVTKQLVKKEAAVQEGKTGNIVDLTGFGLYGNDNMVCSEVSRWVLVKSGRDIPESASPLKRVLGIHYGPANFFSDDYNFVITPLWQPVEK